MSTLKVLSGKLVRGSECAAGLDIVANEKGIIYSDGSLAISTGLKIEIADGFYGKVASRSGLSFKFGIEVGAGIIDSDYRGEVKVLLRNHGHSPFKFDVGDRIAQLIIMPYDKVDIEYVEELSDTTRGEAGFGSSGK